MVHTEILVIDDDSEIRFLLRAAFEREGYAVLEAADATSALSRIKRGGVSLITLDLMLGADDGLKLARAIQAICDVPIIMVSAKGDPVDRIVGLEIGADDYISKPFVMREVVARVRAVLRRHEPAKRAESIAPHERFAFDGWELDMTSRELKHKVAGTCELTTGEFNLLDVFVRRPQRVLSRDDIMDLLKGHEWSPVDRSIDALVARLRKKINTGTSGGGHIKTVRGVGYVFSTDVQRL
jgi:two-component system OmpR family response regulator